MPTAFIRPLQVELTPSQLNPPEQPPTLFTIRVLYREGGSWQQHALVHVPASAQQAFEKGAVSGFHLETLKANDSASRALPGVPMSVVLGLELRDGSRRLTIPKELLSTRRRLLAQGVALTVAGLATLSMTSAMWVGVAALVWSTHALRTALGVPVKPFWPPLSSTS